MPSAYTRNVESYCPPKLEYPLASSCSQKQQGNPLGNLAAVTKRSGYYDIGYLRLSVMTIVSYMMYTSRGLM